jgi:uncharacterized protein involved in exopolysaccharide biosynthesis
MGNNTAIDLQSRLAEIFAHRKLLIAAVFLFVLAAGMITTFLITPKYEATMSILVTRDRIDPGISSTDRNSEIIQSLISDEEFNSELELIRSVDVLRGVVTDLDLINDSKPVEGSWQAQLRSRIKTRIYDLLGRWKEPEEQFAAGSPQHNFALEKAVNRVDAALDAVPVKKSRVIKVTYTDTDPIRAKRTLEKIYEHYVALHVRINERPEAEEVFNEQTQRFEQNLNATSNALKRFDQQNGVSGAEIGTQRELVLKQLYETQAQASATQTEIGETEQRISALRDKIADMPEQIQTSSVSRYVGALDEMKAQLVKLEQQHTDLMQRYKPTSRFVRENQEKIDELKRSIARETANPPQEKSFALNDLRRKLEGDLNDAQARLAGLKKRQTTLQMQAAKLGADVTALNTKSIERDDLARERAINEEAYLLYQKKARENEVSQVLNREQVLNFTLVDPPRTDGEQKTPKPLLNLAVLIVVGAFAGLGSAMIASLAHPSNRLPAATEFLLQTRDYEKYFGLPVLASIPQIEERARSENLRLSA